MCKCFQSFGFSADLNIHCSGCDHAIVILHTHSDDSSGDLWYTSFDEDTKDPAAIPIGSVCIFLISTSHI
jgi:hypothetical protein